MNSSLYELNGNLRDDRVTVGAQSSHAAGYPMSQRECAGFNWPPLAVSAANQVCRPSSPLIGAVPSDAPSLWSRVVGVAHVPFSNATVLRDESVLPASLLPLRAGVPAIGVGQADR